MALFVFIKIVKFGNKIQKQVITSILVNVLLKINVLKPINCNMTRVKPQIFLTKDSPT